MIGVKNKSSLMYDSHYINVNTDDDYEKAYVEQLKKFTKQEIKNVKVASKIEKKAKKKELNTYQGKWWRYGTLLWHHTVGRLGEDWVFLAFLGIVMALISYGIDKLIYLSTLARMTLYKSAPIGILRYLGWVVVPFVLIMFNVGFVSIVGPQSAGSGLPELKTILRGVVLKEYLTFRVLIAKIFGIACTIGAGMPLGKEGPLVHMSSIVTTLYAKFISKMKEQLDVEEIRKTEMLAAACAVGVATTFAAPIGGVLFSIEVTTSYFAVRNYFRGFFAAVCGAITYRLLAVWIDGVQTYTPVFKTNFSVDLPFDPQELIIFAFMGVFCGFTGALYCWCHRTYVLFTKRNKFLKWLNGFCRFVYPAFVVLTVSSIMYPPGIGKYLAGHLPPKGHVDNLFANFSWFADGLTRQQELVLNNWRTNQTGLYLHLLSFMGFMFFISIFASTMPVPNGTFIPTFRFGAAFGRIIGELMILWFPNGLQYGGRTVRIVAGGYATVGAAAFTGAITQTVSVAVIVFEMTGQICHAIPILIAVLIAVGISSYLGPSTYNNIIIIKKLPYLPDLLPSCSSIYGICARDFMIQDVIFVHTEMTYFELEQLLRDNPKLKSFPVVQNAENKILLGSVKRCHLVTLLETQIGRKKRLQYIFGNYFSSQQQEGDKKIGSGDNRLSTYDNELFHSISAPKLSDDAIEQTTTMYKKKKAAKLLRPIRDLSEKDRKKWEEIQMASLIDVMTCAIDPAPFQLVECTSLLKVHFLFSMMGLNVAYVTSVGRLVGVVSLTELRLAMENVNNHQVRPNQSNPYYVTTWNGDNLPQCI